MNKRFYSLIYLLVIAVTLVFGQDSISNNKRYGVARNSNTTKEVYDKEFGKDMTFLGIPIKGSTVQFSKKLEKVKFKSILSYDDIPEVYLFNKGRFLDIGGWQTSTYSTSGFCVNENTDTVYRMCISKLIRIDSTDYYFDKAKDYITKTYPYIGYTTFYNSRDHIRRRIEFVTAYGYIVLDYYHDKGPMVYFRASFDNICISYPLEEDIYQFNIRGLSDHYRDKKALVYYDAKQSYVLITAIVDGKWIKIMPKDKDLGIFFELFNKDLKNMKGKPMATFIDILVNKNINKPHDDLCAFVSESDVYDFYKELEEKERQAAIDRQKREEYEKLKNQYMFDIIKIAVNMVGDTFRNYETTEEWYRKRGYY